MEPQKIATRDAYGEALIELGRKNKNVVVLDADLSDSTRSEKFQKAFPERFFSMGIAEQNMIGAAAGLSVSGKIPFASTFAIFSERAIELTRNIISRNRLNVKIAGSHAGIFTGEDGKSAQAIEDVSLYRSLPYMTVIQPCDAVETRKAVFALEKYKGPSYMRLFRNPLPVIHDEGYNFEIGKGDVLRKGKDAAIVATGPLVHEALSAHNILKKLGIDAGVVNMHTIKPIDKELIIRLAKETKAIVAAEDHNIIGGLGSAVAEVLAENYPCWLKRIGLKDCYAESGKPSELYKKYGLTPEELAKAVKDVIKIKGRK